MYLNIEYHLILKQILVTSMQSYLGISARWIFAEGLLSSLLLCTYVIEHHLGLNNFEKTSTNYLKSNVPGTSKLKVVCLGTCASVPNKCRTGPSPLVCVPLGVCPPCVCPLYSLLCLSPISASSVCQELLSDEFNIKI